jgi:hypothetical protein
MASDEKIKSDGGCFGKLMGLFVFLVIFGLVTAIWYIAKPQDFSDIEGYSKDGAKALAVSPARDLTEVLKKSLEEGHSVVIRENEINRMLARELEMKQGGIFAEWVRLKQVLVRLEDNVAEIIVVRDVMGYEVTVSMFIQVEKTEDKKGIKTDVSMHGGSYHESVPFLRKGGRFGSLTVPQGFLILVMPEFRKIGALFEKEIGLVFKDMSSFEIKKGSLYLDPKAPEEKVVESF